MGFRYRKSIRLGGGFRINISGSGIGYSWGVPGYRITKTANGKIRQTASIPGTGISYVSEESIRSAYPEIIWVSARVSGTRLLIRMKELVDNKSQFIIATHSPILLSYPGADIYRITNNGFESVTYEETDQFKLTKYFINNYPKMLDELGVSEDNNI